MGSWENLTPGVEGTVMDVFQCGTCSRNVVRTSSSDVLRQLRHDGVVRGADAIEEETGVLAGGGRAFPIEDGVNLAKYDWRLSPLASPRQGALFPCVADRCAGARRDHASRGAQGAFAHHSRLVPGSVLLGEVRSRPPTRLCERFTHPAAGPTSACFRCVRWMAPSTFGSSMGMQGALLCLKSTTPRWSAETGGERRAGGGADAVLAGIADSTLPGQIARERLSWVRSIPRTRSRLRTAAKDRRAAPTRLDLTLGEGVVKEETVSSTSPGRAPTDMAPEFSRQLNKPYLVAQERKALLSIIRLFALADSAMEGAQSCAGGGDKPGGV